MDSKYVALLGHEVRRLVKGERIDHLDDVRFGRMIESYVATLQEEEQRDARDKANGKGELK
jgi:hypothetical protein